jgi:hypothetical protein
MRCPECGSPNPDAASACRECGAPLPVRPAGQEVDGESSATGARSQVPPLTSALAIASLVCGILSWALFPVIGSVLAVSLGYAARAEIRRSDGRLVGSSLATTGLVLGYSSIVVAVVGTALGIGLSIVGVALPLGAAGCSLCAGL